MSVQSAFKDDANSATALSVMPSSYSHQSIIVFRFKDGFAVQTSVLILYFYTYYTVHFCTLPFNLRVSSSYIYR